MRANVLVSGLIGLLLTIPSQVAVAQSYAGFHLGAWSVAGEMSVGNPRAVADDRFVVVAGGDRSGDLLYHPQGPLSSNVVSIAVADQAGLRWVGGGTLPHAAETPFSLFMHGGALYVISRGIIHRGAIDAAGQLAPWQIVGNWGADVAPHAEVLHGFVFLFIDGARAIASARLLDSGVGPLQPAGTLPAVGGGFTKVFATRTHVYLFSEAAPRSSYSVMVAEAREDGTLGPWRQTANAPAYPLFAVGRFGDYLYAFGAWGDGAGDYRSVLRARTLLDGSLVEWESQTQAVRRYPNSNLEPGHYSYRSGVVAGRYALWFGGTRRTGGYMQYVDGQIVRSVIGSPVVRSQSPDPVPTTGGRLIVEGVNFVAETRVFVNDSEVVPTTITPTTILVTIPGASEGPGQLRILNPDGESTTAPFRYALSPGAPSAAPRTLTAGVGSFVGGTSLVTLTWQPPQSVAPLSYLVEAGYAPDATTFAVNVGQSLSFTAAAPAGTYYVRVRSLLDFGSSAASNEVIVVAGQAAAPTNLAWSLSPGRTVTLTWNDASGPVTHYLLEAGTSAGSVNVGSFAISGSSVVVPNAPPGTYYVRVRGVSTNGITASSNEVVVVVP
jgi:hypothetical protein